MDRGFRGEIGMGWTGTMLEMQGGLVEDRESQVE